MEEMMEAGGGSRERKGRPQEPLNCPRCKSNNTKFCYFNNYSLTQPRYFCKSCRRYWTQGGSLRNIPVGGGSRKNRKSNSTQNAQPQNYRPHDLNLSFPAAPGGFSTYIPNLMPFSVHSTGVSAGGHEIKYEESDGGRFGFSFEEDQAKQQLFSGANGVDLMSSKGQESSSGYWGGMFGGGPW